ncbi:MAG TPA: hypothetical protein VJU13_12300 [Candidatus Nitrosocosmicus sp.]|nr:hypothetical protein [Candidatus Nitrosocosmicus sp.]
MNTEILSFEFEWYLRDYFFRVNNKNDEDFKDTFDINEICRYMKENYLKYKNWNMEEITKLFNIVILDLHNRNVLIFKNDVGAAILQSRFVRKQCSNCYYVNYLSSLEPPNCHRCKSDNLKDFPSRK